MNTRTKYVVAGYIREHQHLLFAYVPLLINYLCLRYYYLKDNWDLNNSSNDLVCIDNDINYSLPSHNGYLSFGKYALLSNVIKNGWYSWKFKIMCIPPCRHHYSFRIGVFKCDSNTNRKNLDFWNKTSSYAFDIARGLICDEKYTSIRNHVTYYSVLNSGISRNDILQLVLDLDNFELRLFINDVEFNAKHINIEDTGYIAALFIHLNTIDDGINLISVKLIDTNHT